MNFKEYENRRQLKELTVYFTKVEVTLMIIRELEKKGIGIPERHYQITNIMNECFAYVPGNRRLKTSRYVPIVTTEEFWESIERNKIT